MDQTELQALFEANAELNSPKVQAARALQDAFLVEKKQATVEPLEAKLRISYVDTAEFEQKFSQMEQLLQEMHEAQETDRQAYIKSEKDSRARDRRTFIVAVLTLLATIGTVIIGVKTIWP